ncbi:MAG: cytidine deaminase [Lentisphaerae bacterium]|nr:cytidine deaminase [Lentisphaerota bacterium]
MEEREKRDLLEKASEACNTAHAPYSRFRVGAAVLAHGGEVFTGCNVENASYGLTVCAERVALWNAVSAGHRTFHGMALVTNGDKPAAPCGACRQVMAEFCGDSFPIFSTTLAGKESEQFLLGDLLPHAFRFPPAEES